MREIVVSMTRSAYREYMKKDGGFKDRRQLISYLNKTGGYLGTVVEINVEEDPILKPKAKEEL